MKLLQIIIKKLDLDAFFAVQATGSFQIYF